MADPIAEFRILDANLNRAVEGLRVVEEYLRFDLDDSHRTRCYKKLRHDLVAAMACVPQDHRYAARDTQADVGTDIAASQEYHRTSTLGVALASQARVEQALRCLEEYSKAIAPDVARSIEQLRYQAYQLGRTLLTVQTGRERLKGAELYVLMDGRSSEAEFIKLATELIEGGVSAIQLREKQRSDREVVSRARILRDLTRNRQTLFIVNDRPDIAVLSDADGVHIGQEELPVKDARRILGADKLVGVSTHAIEQARQAVLDGANYIGCGPTFPSGTKPFDHFPGISFLREVAAEVTLPAFAIGGIDEGNLGQVLDTGIHRIAVAGAVCESPEPADAVRRLLEQLRNAS